MGLQIALSTARNALLATSSQIAVASRNVTGAGDSGYTRKIATLVTGEGTAQVVITRAGDQALFTRKLAATSDEAASAARLDGLKTLAQTVGDTGDATSPAARLGALNAALLAAANQPDSSDLARTAIDAARDLAGSLNDAAASVATVRADADAATKQSVQTVNDLLKQFDAVNFAVVTGTANGKDITDSLDDRDRILTKLSAEMGITTLTRPDGGMAIYTDGGVALYERGARTVRFDPNALPPGNAVTIDGVAVTGATAAMPLHSGRIAGLTALRDGPAVEYGRQLDAIASALVDAFAETDPTTTPASVVAGLFTGASAAAIRVAARVDPQQGGAVSRLRDGGIFSNATAVNALGEAGYAARLTALTGNLAAARTIGAGTDLSGTATLAGFASASAGWLSQQRKGADADAAYQATLLSRASDALSNAAGVNGDDETALTLQLERSYTASAKILTVVDDLLKTLMDAVR
ncbi:flagellar hook-associated protein FlgK [Methylobacterium radiodurans]|uniref:Flagellar hook-associated protein 1 n=1 Tax=Methylobacterium radiodurans TaxID=2202828 RepID=A0A2U8VV86_9HYPH|nr:flagellar hook-associated protein FlgK [Methylobacterium radiodurans]AWN37637.1 flagellar hook-associated protein FlgK [Methylobacterium radiodurans]